MEALLRVISGPNAGSCFVLEERVRLGRAPDADIQLDEPQVSRHHARIRRQQDGSFELSDLASTSGTTVNGAPVDKKILQPHDVIAIGRSRFSFELATETSTAASFSRKARGFSTLRPTKRLSAVSSAVTLPPTATRTRHRITPKDTPAAREANVAACRDQRKAGDGLDAILGPPDDLFAAASRSAGVAQLGSAGSDSGGRTSPAAVVGPPGVPAPSDTRRTRPRSVVAADNPRRREAALTILRDVLDYQTLHLDGQRGLSMDTNTKSRYAQLTTRLLVETHGLPSSRRYVREPCPLPATLTQCDGALLRTLEVSLGDLSAGGARLAMYDPSVRVGDEVWMALDLAALFSIGQKVVFRSRVVWTRGGLGSTGLMFGGNAHFVDSVEAAIVTG